MLPTWPGADHCYTFLTQHVQETEYARYLAEKKKRKGRPIRQWTADERSCDIIDALNKGDQEQIKAWALQIKTERWLKGETK